MTTQPHVGVLANEDSWYFRDLARAARDQNLDLMRYEFSRLSGWIDHDGTQIKTLSGVQPPEAIIVRTMPPGSLEQVIFRMNALAVWQEMGCLVVNSPRCIECAVDKYLTTHRLSQAGLPVPKTITCEDSESAIDAFAQLGSDVVVKPLFGSEGRGIVRVDDPDLAWRTFRTLERLDAVLYVQEFVQHPGWDVRVMVLGGKILGAVKRFGGEDFRTNVSRKGSTILHSPTDTECQWALRAAESVEATFAGIDILYDDRDAGYVIEVNAVPGWRAFSRTTQIDVAGKFLTWLQQHIHAVG